MSTLPKALSIELSNEDLASDRKSILQAMRKIRRESIKLNACEDNKREEYLHLASRLASIIGTEDESFLQIAREVLSNSDRIRDFDLLKRGTKQEDLYFDEKLQRASIALLGKEYSAREDTYHVLQALKYLDSCADDRDEHKNICLSVRPFQMPTEQHFSKTKIFLASIFGRKYPVNGKQGLEIHLGTIFPEPQELLDSLKEQGYASVVTTLQTPIAKETGLKGWNREIISSDGETAKVRYIRRDLEEIVSIDFDEIFERAALKTLPAVVEKNLGYRIGRPSMFGKSIEDCMEIDEFDYSILAGAVVEKFKKMFKLEIDTHMPKSRKEFDSFVKEMTGRFLRCRSKEFSDESNVMYNEGDEVFFARGLGANGVAYYVKDEILPGESFRVLGREDTIELSGKKQGLLVKGKNGSTYKLLVSELEPSFGIKKRFVESLVDEAKKEYDEKRLGPRARFIIDNDNEVAYYAQEGQKIWKYEKSNFFFMGPGKRVIISAFNWEDVKFDGISKLGRELIDSPLGAKEIVSKYLENRQTPYFSVVQYVAGKKVNDFEVRK